LNRKRNVRSHGVISIFLSVILVGVISLEMLLLETGRFIVGKTQLNEASLSAMLSLLADFQTQLHDLYGVMGMNPLDDTYSLKSTDALTAEYKQLLLYNSDSPAQAEKLATEGFAINNISKLYSVEVERVSLTPLSSLADPAVLKRQILEFSKIRAPMSIAGDLLNVDGWISELKNMVTEIPIAGQLLDSLNVVNSLYSALTAMGDLIFSIADMQAATADGGDWTNGIAKAVLSFVLAKPNNTYTPAYNQAYDDLKAKVDEKLDYMRNNPPPPEPNPAPKDAALTALQSSNATKAYTSANLRAALGGHESYVFWKAVESILNSVPSESLDVSQIAKSVFSTQDIDKIGIVSPYASVSAVLSVLAGPTINMGLTDANGDGIFENLGARRLDATAKANSFRNAETAYQNALNADNAAGDVQRSKEADYRQKEQEYKDSVMAYNNYHDEINRFNREILACLNTLRTRSIQIKKMLGSYRNSLEGISGKIKEAINSIAKKQENDEKRKEEQAKKEGETYTNPNEDKELTKVSGLLNNAANALGDTVANLAQAGIDALSEQINSFDALNTEENIRDRVKPGFLLSPIQKLPIAAYHMSKSIAVAFVADIVGISLLDSFVGKVSDLLTILGKIGDIFSQLGSLGFFDISKTQNLSAQTTSILPRNQNVMSDNVHAQADKTEIVQMLTSARSLVGRVYQLDIDLVDPSSSSAAETWDDRFMTAMNKLTSALTTFISFSGDFNSEGSFGLGNFIITMATKYVKAFKEAFLAIGDLLSLIGEILGNLGKRLRDNLLLSAYASQMGKFEMRTSENSLNDWAKAMPSNAQTFDGAEVEYILMGRDSEIMNQTTCALVILGLRILLNLPTAFLSDPIAAPICEIPIIGWIIGAVWAVAEGYLDLLLLTIDWDVPLYKMNLWTSGGEGTKDLLDNALSFVSKNSKPLGDKAKKAMSNSDNETVRNASKQIEADKAAKKKFKEEHTAAQNAVKNGKENMIDNLINQGYDFYLFVFLLFTPNNTKVVRMADLMQMRVRRKLYEDAKKGVVTPDFQMRYCYTYLRAEVAARHNPLMPVYSSGKVLSLPLLHSTKYAGW
jgi:hypothetical protein